jgi:hypothetical protein
MEPNFPYTNDETGLDDFDQPIVPEPDDITYTIVRFKFNEGHEMIKEGVTLEEAQEHCERDDSRGEGWFDGWYREN